MLYVNLKGLHSDSSKVIWVLLRYLQLAELAKGKDRNMKVNTYQPETELQLSLSLLNVRAAYYFPCNALSIL